MMMKTGDRFEYVAKLGTVASIRFVAVLMAVVLPGAAWSSDHLIPTLPDIQPATQSLASVRGQLRPVQHAVLAAGMFGQLSKFPIVVGSRVKEGDLLVEFNCLAVEAEMAMSVARLSSAKTALEVNMRLAEMENISALAVEQSKAEVAVGEADLRRSEAAVDQCKIYAPFAGTVIEKFVQSHQFVAAGEPLLRLVDANNLEVEAVLPSSWLLWLKPGVTFKVRVDELGLVVDAKLTRVVDEVDPVSQTIRILGSLVAPPPELLPGMSGRLIFRRQ